MAKLKMENPDEIKSFWVMKRDNWFCFAIVSGDVKQQNYI